jgi:hypothetical protein
VREPVLCEEEVATEETGEHCAYDSISEPNGSTLVQEMNASFDLRTQKRKALAKHMDMSAFGHLIAT